MSRLISKRFSIALVAVTTLCLSIPAAATVSSWSTPVTLSTLGGDAEDARVASTNGLAVAVWERYDGTDDIIQASTSLNGGAWTAPVNVSLSLHDSENVEIIASSNNLFVVAWEGDASDTNEMDVIWSSSSSDGVTWTPPVALINQVGNEGSDSPELAVGPNGAVSAVWDTCQENDEYTCAVSASHSLNGTDWSSHQTISRQNVYSRDAQLVVDSNGLATAIWVSGTWDEAGNNMSIESSTSLNGAPWSEPLTLSAFQDWGGFDIVVAPDGLVTAAWSSNSSETTNHWTIQSSRSLNGATWSTPESLSSSDVDAEAYGPALTVSTNGLLTATWEIREDITVIDSNYIIQSRTSLNGAAWSATVNVSDPLLDSQDVELTINSSNLVTAVWEGDEPLRSINENDGIDDVIWSSSSTDGTTWSTPTALFSYQELDADDPEVTVDNTGLVTVAWELNQPETDDEIIQSSFIRQTVTDPTLAKTGSSIELLLVAGSFAVVSGITLIAARRRKRV